MVESYNIYIDIDSILDFRLKVIETLGFNIIPLIESKDWFNRIADSILGIDDVFISNIIESDRKGMFTYCLRTDIKDIIAEAYKDAYNYGISIDEDIYINIDIDMKGIVLEPESKELFLRSLGIMIPSTMNIELIDSFKPSKYQSIIMYNSNSFIDTLMALDINYMDKKLYTPMLTYMAVSGLNVKEVIESLEEITSVFIDVTYTDVKYFSVPEVIK